MILIFQIHENSLHRTTQLIKQNWMQALNTQWRFKTTRYIFSFVFLVIFLHFLRLFLAFTSPLLVISMNFSILACFSLFRICICVWKTFILITSKEMNNTHQMLDRFLRITLEEPEDDTNMFESEKSRHDSIRSIICQSRVDSIW